MRWESEGSPTKGLAISIVSWAHLGTYWISSGDGEGGSSSGSSSEDMES